VSSDGHRRLLLLLKVRVETQAQDSPLRKPSTAFFAVRQPINPRSRLLAFCGEFTAKRFTLLAMGGGTGPIYRRTSYEAGSRRRFNCLCETHRTPLSNRPHRSTARSIGICPAQLWLLRLICMIRFSAIPEGQHHYAG
jgi:hypothetical protein